MDQIGKIMDQDKVSIPDLSWLDLEAGDYDNIPTPNNVEILPQLRDAWTHTNVRSTELVPNVIALSPKHASDEVSQDVVSEVVRQAKREMMAGLTGKALVSKLSALYMPEVIKAAKDELVKLSSEQGLLGNVYLDMTAFDSCSDAANYLGKNKVRTARYVVGNPAKHACCSHSSGQCRDMNKKVVASMTYSNELLSEFEQHFKIAGMISADSIIDSKEGLRNVFMTKQAKTVAAYSEPSAVPADFKKSDADLAAAIEKSSSVQEKVAQQQRFYAARPILAFMQDQMLKGKIGNSLKESLQVKFTSSDIATFSPEIKKVAGLQGLLGNVYVDISYYKTTDDAIKAIKNASTTPLYLIQSIKENEFDSSLMKVARATGCSEFPKDGKIDKSAALSYITDLQYSDRISSESASIFKNRVDSGTNVLAVIRDTFLSTQNYTRKTREGGVIANFEQGVSKKATDRDALKSNAVRALEAGISINMIEDKLALLIPTGEAIGMARNALASLNSVDANSLTKCASEKYQLKRDAAITRATKCATCIYTSSTVCTRLGVRFAGSKDVDKAYLELDPKTDKVLFDENPDISRKDMQQEYDMDDSFGSGMNVSMDKLRKEAGVEVDIDFSTEGMDAGLSDNK
jgi:hypothetical protein